MCGIYGMVARDGVVDARPLAAMDEAMVHRGPDDSGTLHDGPCAMGMRRLSIIDLSGGHQPIANEDRAVWVVFNGEIYNHQTLRAGLARRGHRFSTSSDTEAIVHGYEEKGASVVDDLRGMFGFAVWDRRTRGLTLGRDRTGQKPMYYADTPRGLAFASELKSLMKCPWVGRELDEEAVSHYLSFGTTPADRAIVRGVKKLPPGHVLTYRNGRTEVHRYWDLRPEHPTPARSEAEGVAMVRDLLADAVKSHLIADVPVGAFLSGGVDSGTIVAMMARAGARPKTFSIGFDEADFDELKYARMISEKFGTEHYELVVRPDVWGMMDKLVAAVDEPLADVSAVPTYLVSQLAAEQVKVVLSGDGGDEVFGGYDRYAQALAEARRLDLVPKAARSVLGRVSSLLPESAPGKYWLRHAALDPRLRYLDGESLFSPVHKARLLTPALKARLAALGDDPMESRAQLLDGAPGDALGRLMYLDTMTYLPNDILTKVDRMSMAHSLEVRPPLLDHPLMEAVAAMPSAWKVAAGEQKRLLKRAMEGIVPDAILHRAKRGFGVPIRHWFRGPLREAARTILTEKRTRERGLMNGDYVEALVTEHESGRRDQSLRMWSLLVLEMWSRQFLDGSGVAAASAPAGRGSAEVLSPAVASSASAASSVAAATEASVAAATVVAVAAGGDRSAAREAAVTAAAGGELEV